MKSRNALVLTLALMAGIYAANLLVSCSEEKSSNPIESVAPATDNTQTPTDTSTAADSRDQRQGMATRMHWDTRTALILEAYYALSTSVSGYSSRYLNSCAVSDWNYLASDMNAYNVLKGWYGTYSSGWSLFYSNPATYGLYASYGRGGQCVYFSNLLAYRSGVYQKVFPTYATCLADYNSSSRRYTKHYRNIHPGDIIRTFGANGHTAIVVAVLAGNPGSSVTSVDVIDANYIGNENIGRHIISASGSGNGDLDNYYAVDLIALGGR